MAKKDPKPNNNACDNPGAKKDKKWFNWIYLD
jgi:hypothetical protein